MENLVEDNYKLSTSDELVKRTFDIVVSFIGLFFTWWLILLAYIVASIDTKSNGFFVQTRVGQYGKNIKVIKIKTMRKIPGFNTNVTRDNDPRITKSGKFFRKTKIDELPQLINVFLGQMSFVGPRPDVQEMYEDLSKEDKVVLSIKPGITGPATIKYKNEEVILANVEDPEKYNKEIIFVDKVKINKDYIANYNFLDDMKYILITVFGEKNADMDVINTEEYDNYVS